MKWLQCILMMVLVGKMMNQIKQEVDVKINSFGLKIRRLENDNIMLKSKIIELENLIKGE